MASVMYVALLQKNKVTHSTGEDDLTRTKYSYISREWAVIIKLDLTRRKTSVVYVKATEQHVRRSKEFSISYLDRVSLISG